MTTDADLVDLMVAGLRGQTVAGQAVHSCRDWPTNEGDDPIILFDLPQEDMSSLGNGGPPQFTVTSTVPMLARLRLPASEDDAGANAMRASLVTLRNTIKRILINYPPLWQEGLEQFQFIRSQMRVDADGRLHFGELSMHFGLVYYQGPEDFYDPLVGDDTIAAAPALTEFQITTDITPGDNAVTGPRLDIFPPQ